LTRKFGPTLNEVIDYQAKASNRLLELDSSTDEIEQLRSDVAELQSQLLALASNITGVRQKAAVALSVEVTAELAALAMTGAELVVRVDPAGELTQNGADIVTILLAAYPGADPRPLGRGASGGELSRIMLAIEVVLAKSEQTPTFIFDEVDAGVGGAAAIEVGRRLAMLAKQAQVIVVTHLAQVAAYANQHLRVMKSSSNEFTSTSVVELDQNQRVEELTRMLSGLTESDSGRAHAFELLQRAKQEFN
jgi:DNA repair protein RecN (Recombination protein N)